MLDENDKTYLDTVYVRKDKCDEKMTNTNDRFTSLKTDVEVMKTKLNWLIAILAAIAVPVLGIAIKLIFGGN